MACQDVLHWQLFFMMPVNAICLTFQDHSSLPEYQRQEEKLLCIIYEKYLGTGLSAKEEQQLKNIDNDLLWYDLKFLLNEEPPQPKPSVCVPIDYTVRPFQEVEDEYRMLFKQLRADIHNSDLLDHD